MAIVVQLRVTPTNALVERMWRTYECSGHVVLLLPTVKGAQRSEPRVWWVNVDSISTRIGDHEN